MKQLAKQLEADNTYAEEYELEEVINTLITDYGMDELSNKSILEATELIKQNDSIFVYYQEKLNKGFSGDDWIERVYSRHSTMQEAVDSLKSAPEKVLKHLEIRYNFYTDGTDIHYDSYSVSDVLNFEIYVMVWEDGSDGIELIMGPKDKLEGIAPFYEVDENGDEIFASWEEYNDYMMSLGLINVSYAEKQYL